MIDSGIVDGRVKSGRRRKEPAFTFRQGKEIFVPKDHVLEALRAALTIGPAHDIPLPITRVLREESADGDKLGVVVANGKTLCRPDSNGLRNYLDERFAESLGIPKKDVRLHLLPDTDDACVILPAEETYAALLAKAAHKLDVRLFDYPGDSKLVLEKQKALLMEVLQIRKPKAASGEVEALKEESAADLGPLHRARVELAAAYKDARDGWGLSKELARERARSDMGTLQTAADRVFGGRGRA